MHVSVTCLAFTRVIRGIRAGTIEMLYEMSHIMITQGTVR